MLNFIIQGYVDSIYVATRLQAPPPGAQPQATAEQRDGGAPAPIEAQVATFCEELIGMVYRPIRVPELLRCGFGRVVLAAAAITVILAVFSGKVGATVLIFDQSLSPTGTTVVPIQAGGGVPQDYGDRVVAASMPAPGVDFTYGSGGEGFTPNVVADYFSGANVALWTIEYGNLTNVLFASAGSNVLSVRLTADPGFEVLLYGFDLAGWPLTDYVIDAVTIIGGATTLFSQSDVAVLGKAAGRGHTAFDFAAPLSASALLIAIDFSNIPAGQQDNIGIDNIRFGQNPPPLVDSTEVPEPATTALFAVGIVAVGFLRRWGKA